MAGSAVDQQFDQITAGLAGPSFASREDVASVAAIIDARIGRGALWQPGAQAQLLVSPGTIAIRLSAGRETSEPVDVGADRTFSPGSDSRMPLDMPKVVGFLQDELFADEPIRGTRDVVKKWSAGSRRRMVRKIAELDLCAWPIDDGVLAMVTLTLPGWWQIIAPSGRAFKRLVELLRRRWARAVGMPWRGLWKQEFQGRGAPHMHMLLRVPATVRGERFEDWLARTWADICFASLEDRPHLRAMYLRCGHYDRHLFKGTDISFSGVKFSDPRRTSVYFSKHSSKSSGSKEYQHMVPALWQREGAGPGRFWGVWGLSSAVGAVGLEWQTMHTARRYLRHLARAQQARTAISRLRAEHSDGSPQLRRALVAMKRAKVRSLSTAGGWVLLNDGLATALELTRALQIVGADPLTLYAGGERGLSGGDPVGLDGERGGT
ncbi:MAG: helitron helicase-like domain-containing protein [Actinobacteria bacterium]|nr:helitron helicase-like domain-containing protein [Actinomycetota bacterium]